MKWLEYFVLFIKYYVIKIKLFEFVVEVYLNFRVLVKYLDLINLFFVLLFLIYVGKIVKVCLIFFLICKDFLR